MASHFPSPRSRRRRISASPPLERVPRSRAGNTRLRLKTARSPARSRSGRSRKARCDTAPVARSSTSRREASRSGSGSWAMSSGGRSKSNSEISTESEELLLRTRGPRHLPLEVVVGELRRDSAPRRAVEEPDLQQEGLVDVLDGVGLLADRRRQRAHPHRPAAELVDDGEEQLAVDLVEPVLVHGEQ